MSRFRRLLRALRKADDYERIIRDIAYLDRDATTRTMARSAPDMVLALLQGRCQRALGGDYGRR